MRVENNDYLNEEEYHKRKYQILKEQSKLRKKRKGKRISERDKARKEYERRKNK
jgi:hypothetical protein